MSFAIVPDTSAKSFALSPVLLVPNSAKVFLHHDFLFLIHWLKLGCTQVPACLLSLTSCQPPFVQFTLSLKYKPLFCVSSWHAYFLF